VSIIRTVTVGVKSPLEFSKDYGIGFEVEAPPHIEFFRAKMVFTGTRTETIGNITREEVLNYTKEKTFTRVPMHRDGVASGIFASNGLIYDHDTQFEGSPSAIADDECRITQPTWGTVEQFVSPQIARSAVTIYINNFTAEVVGTRTYTDAGDPANNTSDDITISSWPVFHFTGDADLEEAYRTVNTKWQGARVIPGSGNPSSDPGYVDLTGWDHQKWRSKVGFVNSFTQSESGFRGSGTSSVTATFEWELS